MEIPTENKPTGVIFKEDLQEPDHRIIKEDPFKKGAKRPHTKTEKHPPETEVI